MASAVVPKVHSVPSNPTETGIEPWNTIAPVTLPTASRSFFRYNHKKLFDISGNSVASGAISKARMSGETCSSAEMELAAVTNKWAPPTNPSNPTIPCAPITR